MWLAITLTMSKVRISVEWAFKDIEKYFSHIAVPRKMELSQTPVGAWYLESCLLWNFRFCLEGSPTTMFFLHSTLIASLLVFPGVRVYINI
jgi:hypothetical protein